MEAMKRNHQSGKTISRVNVKKAYENRLHVLESIENMENVHISENNSKMGMIASFSVLPLITCKNCGECSNFCYACKGCHNFPKNIHGLAENTFGLMNGKISEIENKINIKIAIIRLLDRPKYFRFNEAGDVFSVDYLEMIIRIAKKNKDFVFMFFTKNYDLMNNYFDDHKKPGNLTICFSQWGETKVNNPHRFPLAIVRLSEEQKVPKKAFECTGDCQNCLKCFNAKKGDVVYFWLH